ncbi:MAG TPA: ATP-grasp domain-containing protein [Gammaproteobacteria bacterium]|nr:ATP-grasp domain-containing protein [Gammaproteobacteria bacterium]
MPDVVMVLDGAQRSALAVVRSLGSCGIRVYAADTGAACLAARSRHCAGHEPLPSPQDSPERFVAAVIEAAGRVGADMILPMTDASTMLLVAAAAQSRLPDSIRIAAPGAGPYETLSDKASLISLAGAAGIPVPRTVIARSRDELVAATTEIGFPCVLKPARSKFRHGDRLVSTTVTIARDAGELVSSRAVDLLELMPLLVQEFIPGHGAGVFSMYGEQGPVAWFAHRRLREKPPSGGVSVLCESTPVDPAMRDYAERLLSTVNWFGPAMVEFRIDPDGKPWLMEINGRFWGSLQLAIDCGVDFPRLLYRLCQGEQARGPGDYVVGRKLRWLLGDLDHLLLQLRGKGTAESFRDKLAAAGRFMSFFDSRTRLEVLRAEDLRPFRHELAKWLRDLRSG